MLSNQLCGAGNTGVTHCWGVVILTNNMPSLSWIGGDHFTIVLPPFSLDFDEVVSVYPRFEGWFVLGWKCRQGSDKEVFGEDGDVFVIAISLIIVRSSR